MEKELLAQQIAKATEAHESWKVKLRDAVKSGHLPKPARDISSDCQCSFGKWLQDLKSSRAMSVSLDFRKVVAAHADFHVEAGRIAGLIEVGDKAGAEAALNGPALNDRSRRLGDAMHAWRASL